VIEYNALQEMSETDHLVLLEKNVRFFEFIEKPSALVKCIYAEKMVGKVYINIKDGKELMEALGIYKSNAIHFIKDKK